MENKIKKKMCIMKDCGQTAVYRVNNISKDNIPTNHRNLFYCQKCLLGRIVKWDSEKDNFGIVIIKRIDKQGIPNKLTIKQNAETWKEYVIKTKRKKEIKYKRQ